MRHADLAWGSAWEVTISVAGQQTGQQPLTHKQPQITLTRQKGGVVGVVVGRGGGCSGETGWRPNVGIRHLEGRGQEHWHTAEAVPHKNQDLHCRHGSRCPLGCHACWGRQQQPSPCLHHPCGRLHAPGQSSWAPRPHGGPPRNCTAVQSGPAKLAQWSFRHLCHHPFAISPSTVSYNCCKERSAGVCQRKNTLPACGQAQGLMRLAENCLMLKASTRLQTSQAQHELHRLACSMKRIRLSRLMFLLNMVTRSK